MMLLKELFHRDVCIRWIDKLYTYIQIAKINNPSDLQNVVDQIKNGKTNNKNIDLSTPLCLHKEPREK